MMRKIYYEESIFDRPQNSLEELNTQARLGGYPYFLVISKFTKKLLLGMEDKENLAAAYIFNTTNKHINNEDDLVLAAYVPFNLSSLGQIEIHWQLFGSSEVKDTHSIDFLYPYENSYKKLFSKIYSYPGDLDILSKMIYTRDIRLLAKNGDITIGREVPDTGLYYYLLRVFPKSIIVDGKVLFAGIYTKAHDMKDSPFEPIPDSLVVGFEYDEENNVVRIYDFYYDTREECFKVMTSYKREYNVAHTPSEMVCVLLNVMYNTKEYIEIDKKYFGNKKFRKEQREKEKSGGKNMELFNEKRNEKIEHTFKKAKSPRYINNFRVVATIFRNDPNGERRVFHLMEYMSDKGLVKLFNTATDTMCEFNTNYLSRFYNLKANAEDIIESEREIKVPKDFDKSVLSSGFFAWDASSNVTARVNNVIVIGAYKHVPKDIDKINLSFLKRNKRLDLMNSGDLVIGLDKDSLDRIEFVNSEGEVVDYIPVDEKVLTEALRDTGVTIPAKVIEIMYNNAIILKDNCGIYKKVSKLRRYFDNLD